MDCCKLLDNGWRIVLFRDGLGSYSALAVRDGETADGKLAAWQEDETEHPLNGVNRYVGGGFTPADALKAVTEKVLHNRLPSLHPEFPLLEPLSLHRECLDMLRIVLSQGHDWPEMHGTVERLELAIDNLTPAGRN